MYLEPIVYLNEGGEPLEVIEDSEARKKALIKIGGTTSYDMRDLIEKAKNYGNPDEVKFYASIREVSGQIMINIWAEPRKRLRKNQ